MIAKTGTALVIIECKHKTKALSHRRRPCRGRRRAAETTGSGTIRDDQRCTGVDQHVQNSVGM